MEAREKMTKVRRLAMVLVPIGTHGFAGFFPTVGQPSAVALTSFFFLKSYSFGIKSSSRTDWN